MKNYQAICNSPEGYSVSTFFDQSHSPVVQKFYDTRGPNYESYLFTCIPCTAQVVVPSCVENHNRITKNDPSDLEDFNMATEIMLYPNPTYDAISFLNIKIGDRITFFNQMGILIYFNICSEIPYTYNTFDLQPGIYFIRINDSGNYKLIKI